MYERFTDRARKAMALANQEAQRLDHEHIDTGHILLGIVREGQGVACVALLNLKMDLRKVRLEFEKRVKPGPDIVTIGILTQAPFTKKVIEYAIKEAHGLNHNYVGTEHLLLGLLHKIKDSQGKYQYTIAGKILRSSGLTFKTVREEVLNLLGVTEKKKKHKIKKVATKKKQRPVKCKIFELDEEKITKFLETREFVQATQSFLIMPSGYHTQITIFYRDGE